MSTTSNRLIAEIEYRTPKSLRITSPMRRSVHSSVEYPAARAPRSRTLASALFCPADNRHGRPGVGFGLKPLEPPRRYAWNQRTTELSEAPKTWATPR